MFKWYFIIVALVIVLLSTYYLISDFIGKNTTIWSYFIIFYLGVFCLYTAGSSIRYYHILTILLFLYLSINSQRLKEKFQFGFITIVLINILFIQITLWNINFTENRKVKAMIFKIGIKNTETSAHFLNFSNVIDFVRKNKIGEIKTIDPFFIGNGFNFYKHVYPEIENYNNSASINYDYTIQGSGFKMDFIENKNLPTSF